MTLSYRALLSAVVVSTLISASGCKSIDVLGASLRRLTPASVAASDTEAAWRLFDRDAATRFDAGRSSRIAVDFGSASPIVAVKVFGTSPYALVVKSDRGETVAGPFDLRVGGEGWNEFTLAQPASARALSLVLTAYGDPAEVGDIELWSAGAPAPMRYQPSAASDTNDSRPDHVDVIVANEGSVKLSSANSGGRAACVAFSFELERHPGTYRRAWIRYQTVGAYRPFVLTRAINQHSMVRGHWVATNAGTASSFAYAIDPEQLLLGENQAHFCVPAEADSEVTISQVELVGEVDHGSNFIESITTASRDGAPTNDAFALFEDSGTATIASGDELVLAFDRLIEVDGFTLETDVDAVPTVRCVDEAGDAHSVALRADEQGERILAASGQFVVRDGAERCAGLRIAAPTEITVSGLRVFGSGAARRVDFPQVVVASPLEHYGYQAWVDGWVRAPSDVGGGVATRVDSIAASSHDGVFGEMLTRSSDPTSAWVVTVRGRLSNGREVSRQIVLDDPQGALPGTHGLQGVVDDGLTATERSARFGVVGARAEQSIGSGAEGRVALGSSVSIDIPAGALQGQKTVSITHLDAAQLPTLDPGMVNVTAPFAHGYEFLPHGEQFNGSVAINLPYQPNLVPEGYTVHDIETWYYDESLERWEKLARDHVDPSASVVKSLTDHFTVMINAIVVTPEHPETSSFDGNRMSGLEAAHPGAGITSISPPTANNRGDVSLQYPLGVPPGRRGMQPQLALSYSSEAANGWLGVGWDLSMSSISVETRFGAPRYDDALETETYVIDGTQLAPTAHRADFRPRTNGATRFWRRTEQEFERVVRYGSTPEKYYWVVTSKDGTRRYYGRGEHDPMPGGARQPAAIGAANGIFRWYLREVVDTFGNRVRYEYELLGGAGPDDRRALVPSSIHYTLAGTETTGIYQVHFCRESTRPDPVVSGRGGFLEHIGTRLGRVEVHYNATSGSTCRATAASSFVRGWQLAYHATSGDPSEGYVDPFGKSRLASIQQLGLGGSVFEGARHEFTYYDDIREGTAYTGFSAGVTSQGVDAPDTVPIASTIVGGISRALTPQDVDLPNGAAVNSSVLGGTRSFSGSVGVYIGINPFSGSKTLSGGVSINTSFTQTAGLAQLVDVDADGLSDHVICNRSSCSYNRNLGAANGQIRFSSDAIPISGLSGINKEQSFAFGVGPNLNAGAQLFYNFGINVARTRVYVTDVNGDGLLDQVDGSNVRFGYYDESAVPGDLDQARIAFSSSSGRTPAPLGSRSSAALGDDELADLEQMIRDMTPAEDAMRLWRAPYDGTVHVSGAIRLVGAPEGQDDGVRVFVDAARPRSQSVESLFTAELGPGAATSTEPALDIPVAAGDHLVFRVHSREDGLHDEVAWAPVIDYTSFGSHLDLAGFDDRHYSAEQDFVPFGSGHSVTLPYSGTVRITGSVEKMGSTNDSVWLEVLENDAVIASFEMGASDATIQHVSFEHAVEVDPPDMELDENDAEVTFRTSTLRVRLASRVPVALSKFRVTEEFSIEYSEARDGDTDVPTVGDDGQPLLRLPVQLDARTLIPVARSAGATVAPATSITFAAPTPPMGQPAATERDVEIYYYAGNSDEVAHEFSVTATIDGRVALARQVPIAAASTFSSSTTGTVTWRMPTNRPVTFTMSGNRETSWSRSWGILYYRYVGDTTWSYLPFQAFAPGPHAPYSAPYRGWRTGSIRLGESPETLTWLEIFGSSQCASEMEGLSRREARKRARAMRRRLRHDSETSDPEQDRDETDPYELDSGDASSGQSCENTSNMSDSPEARRTAMRAVHLGTGCPDDLRSKLEDHIDGDAGTGDVETPDALRCPPLSPPHWRGVDDRVYLTATTMSASRLGPDRLPIERTGPIVIGNDTPDGNGRGVTRIGRTITNSFGGGVQGASFSLGKTRSRSIVDFRDLNGDGLPDLMRPDRVRFTTPTGRLGDYENLCTACNREPVSSSTTGAIGYGSAPLGQRGDGNAQEGGTATDGNPGNPDNDSSWGSFNFSAGLNAGVSRNDWDLIDVNGDGLSDLVRVERDGLLTARTMKVRLNLGYRFAPEESWGAHDLHKSTNFEVNAGVGYTSGDQGWNIGISGSMNRSHVRAPAQPIMEAVVPDRIREFLGANSTLLDVNADGLVDVVRPGQEGLRVHLNVGNGFSDEEIFWGGGNQTTRFQMVEVSESDSFGLSANGGFTFGIGPIIAPLNLLYVTINPNISASTSDSRPKVGVQDIDGDGAPDHLRSFGPHTVDVALNRTRRTGLLAEVKLPMGASFTVDYAGAGNTRAMPGYRWVMSSVVVHDGLADTVVTGDEADSHITTFAYGDGRFDRREREFLGFGRVTTTDIDSRGYTGGDWSSLVAYRSGEQEFHNATIFDRNLLRRSRSYDWSSGARVLEAEHSGTFEIRNASSTVQAHLDQDGFHEVPIVGLPRILDADWLQIVERSNSTVTYEAGSTSGLATTSSQDVDALGNVIRMTDAGSLATSSDDFTATIGYASCGSTTLDDAYLVGIANSIVVRRLDGVVLRERSSEVDCSTGVISSITAKLNAAESATTTLTYSASGQLTDVSSPSGGGQRYALHYEYDDFVGAHVTSILDSFGYESSAEVDPLLGARTRDTDINGQVVTSVFDDFGRLVSVTGPYEQGEGIATITYDYHPTSGTPWAHSANHDEFHPADPIETFTLVDGLGRVVQVKKDATVFASDDAAGGRDVRIVSGRVQYDPWGRSIKTWHPTVESRTATGHAFVPGTSMVAPTVVAYDANDRPVSTQMPDGSTTRTTFGIEGSGTAARALTDVVDAAGKRSVSLRDVRGLVREVREFVRTDGGIRVDSTAYDFDALGQILQVTDAANHQTTSRYDLAGRRIEFESPDAERTVLTYDIAGNVIRRESAVLRERGQAITYAYDRTHLVRVDHPGDEPDVVYEWGASNARPGQRGRITRIIDAGGTLEREYGPLGEVVTETRHLYRHNQTAPTLAELFPTNAPTDDPVANPQGPRVVTRSRFDTWGRLHELVYPDGEVLRYEYDSGGQVRRATGSKLGVTYPYVTRLEYDEFGQRVFQELGNGIRSHYAYDEETRRLANLESGSFQRLVYNYDAVGNVTSLVNGVGDLPANEHGGHVVQNFVYDDLHRLVSASGEWTEPGGASNRYSLSLAYDRIHNLTRKTQHHTVRHNGSGTGGVTQHRTTYDFEYAYGATFPHAPASVGGQSFEYDASGRQVAVTPDNGGPRRTVLWDSEDRIRAIQDGGAAVRDEQGRVVAGHGRTTSFVYDYEGQRITKSGAQGHTAYASQFYTLRNETIATKHIFVGAARVTSKLVPGTSSADLQVDDDDVAFCLGRWWQHRSENGWEHAQNTEMNPHYQVPTQVPSPMGLPESNFIYFYHSDHLTSTSFVTDGGGEIYEHVEYFPQGEIWADERSNTERLPYLFTSEEMDQETGLYDFGARMYDPRTALWNSPDPAAPSYLDGAGLGGVWNPANLSSMTYALNNPLLFRDPDGRSGTVDHDPANNVIMDRQKQIAVWLGSLSNRRVTFVHGKLTLGDAVRGGHNAGTRLLERIVASDQNVHITYDSGERVAGTEPMSQRNARNGRGSDATVRVNFDAVATRDPATSRLVEGTGGEAVSQTSAPEIVLGHELIHADHMMRGVERRSIYERHAGLYHWNMTPGGRIFERAPIEEARTVGLPGARLSRIDVTENMLRDEGGYAARVRYFAPDIRGWRATPGPHWDR